MTRKERKKAEERFWFQKFLELFPEGIRVVEDDRERPDFVVSDVNDRLVGFELTEYHNNTRVISKKYTRRVVEQAWEKLRVEIQKMVSNDPNVKNLYGTLRFKEICLPPPKKYDLFVDELRKCAISSKSALPLRVVDFSNYPLLNEYLRSLNLREVKCNISWDSSQGTGWTGIDADSFVNLIKQKADDLDSYSNGQNFDGYWLLIMSGNAISQSMGVKIEADLSATPNLSDILEKSKFEKVFVFQYLYDDIYEWTVENNWFKC